LEDDEWILDILAEKAYTVFYKKLNSNLEYFEREQPRAFDMVSENTKNAWRAVVREILFCYPVGDSLEKEEGD
jgi:hypothetical protein